MSSPKVEVIFRDSEYTYDGGKENDLEHITPKHEGERLVHSAVAQLRLMGWPDLPLVEFDFGMTIDFETMQSTPRVQLSANVGYGSMAIVGKTPPPDFKEIEFSETDRLHLRQCFEKHAKKTLWYLSRHVRDPNVRRGLNVYLGSDEKPWFYTRNVMRKLLAELNIKLFAAANAHRGPPGTMARD